MSVNNKRKQSSWQVVLSDGLQMMRTHMVAVVIVGLIVVVTLGTAIYCAATAHLYPGSLARVSLSRLSRGVPSSMLLSLFTVSHPLRLLIDVPIVAVCLGLAQSRLGVGRTLWIAAISTLGGIACGMGLTAAMYAHSTHWMRIADFGFILGPLIIAAGPIMVVSAFSSLLWRRRIRIIMYAFVATLVLYRGEPSDFSVLAATVIGHVLGYLMCSHNERESIIPGTVFETRRVVAIVSAVMALGPVVSVTSPLSYGPLSTFGLLMSPIRFNYNKLSTCLGADTDLNCFVQFRLQRLALPGGIIVSLLPVIAMLLVSWGLLKGRRIAAILSIIANTATIICAIAYYCIIPLAHAYHGLPGLVMHGAFKSAIASIIIPAVCIAMVVVSWKAFDRKTAQRRIMLSMVTIVVSWCVLTLSYILVVLTHAHGFNGVPSFGNVLADVPQRFMPIGFLNGINPDFIPVDSLATVVYEGVGPVFWLITIIMIRWCLLDAGEVDESSRQLASKLVQIDGESMSFMTTWQDNHYWFSPSGRSAIAYRVEHGIALSVTGPFGARDEWDEDIAQFVQFCIANSWTPVFYSIHEHQREILVNQGWSSLAVGTEMIVHPRTWQTRGKKWQDVRTAINKAKREGMIDVLTTFDEAPLGIQSQIVEISEQWTEEKALPEMRFTLGGIEELMDNRVRLLYALDAQGVVQAVTSWLPTYRDGVIIGWTLDFMRHRPDSENGVMEFLIARMAERLQEEDAEFMSLSAAPLAGLSVVGSSDNLSEGDAADSQQSDGTQILAHVLQAVADLIEPAYGFHSLFRFKLKFQPQEEGVYIAYPDAAKLAQIALAVTQSYLPGMKPSDVVTFVKALKPSTH